MSVVCPADVLAVVDDDVVADVVVVTFAWAVDFAFAVDVVDEPVSDVFQMLNGAFINC